MDNRIVVFLETNKDGGFKKSAFELINVANCLAGQLGLEIEAIVMADEPPESIKEISGCGIRCVHYLKSTLFKNYDVHVFAPAFFSAARNLSPRLIMGSASIMGKDLFPRISALFGVPMISDCLRVFVEGGRLKAVRPVFYGKAHAQLSFTGEPPYIVTMARRSSNLKKGGGEARGKTELDVIEYVLDHEPPGRLIAARTQEPGQEDVTEAEIIVSGGRGIKNPEGFKMLAELAKKMAGTVGATRAVVDSGLASQGIQIGQTGKNVSPRLYIALGISGAVQHIAGIRGSKVIVAVNKDPHAPIFNYAKYGIIGDLYEVVPEINKALDSFRD
ncbi:MAG: electron transfer flavoprotein subunit alpha/FixB family protein [Peptococcaceae bacterium]|jgi:electron transfer flavoprotein alpha subunit|nr:electron transfer flavoprotein subunit alpha/FixB family protein [Peptococcaceae bacterium]MDH7525032.1 electron transfer flavoprotein subunit alpha/FixB family protein [Peptococcaceae bacterium]